MRKPFRIEFHLEYLKICGIVFHRVMLEPNPEKIKITKSYIRGCVTTELYSSGLSNVDDFSSYYDMCSVEHEEVQRRIRQAVSNFLNL